MQVAPINSNFDTDGFLDEIHFDEDLSAFSPGPKMLDSPEPKDNHGRQHQHQESSNGKRSARWTDDEVSTVLALE